MHLSLLRTCLVHNHKMTQTQSAGGWNLAECNSETLTTLVKALGCKNVRVEELWSLNPDQFKDIRPVHGLIFFYQWELANNEPNSLMDFDYSKRLYFARQITNNACATQAMLSVILNCSHPDISICDRLNKFKLFCQHLNSTSSGMALHNSYDFRSVHNSLAIKTPIPKMQKNVLMKHKHVFHFISFMPIDGHLYELNGLRQGPINHGVIPNMVDWLLLVKPLIDSYIIRYDDFGIPFNVIAVITDKKSLYETKIMNIEDQLKKTAITEQIQTELRQLKLLIKKEENRAKKFQNEIKKRKHDYTPFIIEMLKICSEKCQSEQQMTIENYPIKQEPFSNNNV